MDSLLDEALCHWHDVKDSDIVDFVTNEEQIPKDVASIFSEIFHVRFMERFTFFELN